MRIPIDSVEINWLICADCRKEIDGNPEDQEFIPSRIAKYGDRDTDEFKALVAARIQVKLLDP